MKQIENYNGSLHNRWSYCRPSNPRSFGNTFDTSGLQNEGTYGQDNYNTPKLTLSSPLARPKNLV
jgi:hypothetical protein